MKGRNIAVDIGNTRIKSGEFDDLKLVGVKYWDALEDLFNHYKDGNYKWGFGSVRGLEDFAKALFKNQNAHFFTTNSKFPIGVDYKTPETLGIDRVLSAIGARLLVPKLPLLIIDMGTCLTIDILDSHDQFQGGVISPGFKMRFKAMNHFTANLPDISIDWEEHQPNGPGKSTKECLTKGAFEGMIHEIKGFISDSKKEFPNLVVIVTGGDAPYFESKLKEPIFADQNLVLKGLNKLLIINS